MPSATSDTSRARRTRILYVTHSRVPSTEANSVQVMKMCDAFLDAGAEVELFCRKKRGSGHGLHTFYGVRPRFIVRGMHLPRLPLLTRSAHSLLTYARLVAGARPDLIYGRDPYLLALLATLPFLRRPLVFEAHLPPTSDLELALQRRIFRSPRFRQLVVISNALADEYTRRFGALVRERIHVARDGANPVLRAQTKRPPRAAGAALQLGYVGSLSPGKGMELIVRLAPLVPDCTLHIIGGGSRDLARWRESCTAPNVVFHGFERPERVSDRIEELDVLLAPYQREVLVGHKRVDACAWMSPLKVFEYMAAEKAIVASRLPVLAEFLRDGENALLAPPEDAQAWAHAIDRLRADPTLGARLGARAGQELRSSYTWVQRARGVLDAVGAA